MPESLITWPRYVGTSKNASTLSPRLHAKARMVEQVLGVTLYLIQGSPSYSDKSGGTHGGPGNAADWASTGSTKLDVKVSALFRLLGCLSYVRGQDVDIDGRPDDSFGPHIHVIDLEDDSALTDAQLWQAGLYRRGLNGLTNMRPDVETRPATTYTLEQYRTLQEENMPLNAADKAWISAEIKKQSDAAIQANAANFKSWPWQATWGPLKAIDKLAQVIRDAVRDGGKS